MSKNDEALITMLGAMLANPGKHQIRITEKTLAECEAEGIPRTWLEALGIVISNDPPPDAIIVCNTPKDKDHLTLPDNRTGQCAYCETLIEWRPHVPDVNVKACGPCAAQQMEATEH